MLTSKLIQGGNTMSIATQERLSGNGAEDQTVSTRARDIATGIFLAGKVAKQKEDPMVDSLVAILQGEEPITGMTLSGDIFEVTHSGNKVSIIAKDGTVEKRNG